MPKRHPRLRVRWLGALAIAVGSACGGAQEEPAAPRPSSAADAAEAAPQDDSEASAASGDGAAEPAPAETTASAPPPEPAANETMSAAEPAEPAAVAGARTGGPLPKVGVPACDDYAKKYMRCIDDNLPAEMAEDLRDSFAQTFEAWKQAADNPDAREMLASACRNARDASKQAMRSYGCEW